jgi:hypothetical protein
VLLQCGWPSFIFKGMLWSPLSLEVHVLLGNTLTVTLYWLSSLQWLMKCLHLRLYIEAWGGNCQYHPYHSRCTQKYFCYHIMWCAAVQTLTACKKLYRSVGAGSELHELVKELQKLTVEMASRFDLGFCIDGNEGNYLTSLATVNLSKMSVAYRVNSYRFSEYVYVQ